MFKYFSRAAATATVLLFSLHVVAQQPAPQPDPPKNWHQLDLKKDGFYGISLNQAYESLKGKKSKTVIVATIDAGIDTNQKDLRPILWTNTKEIPGNGIDDDHNGYVDDVHGWDFLGGKDGKCDFTETTEEVREYNRLKSKYLGTSGNPGDKEYAYWMQVKAVHDSTVNKDEVEMKQLQPLLNALTITNTMIKQLLHRSADQTFNKIDIAGLRATNDTITDLKSLWTVVFSEESNDATNVKVIKDLTEYLGKLNNDLNPDLDSRKRIVGDDPDVWDSEKGYGNNLLKFEDAMHGTMVAGFIGAVRNNGYGIDGVADNVRIMAIKAVPNGDEYDKDIAHAIRYAVDNGAQVVNMSFGKKLSPHKQWVDDAFKYAAAHDVLLVQAAGNDNADMDTNPEFPNDTFADGSATDADNVISVGASGPRNDESLAASFSNYGQKNVDVFAPGQRVTSVGMDAEFSTEDGTSFASPITAGIAALLLEYYPDLSAHQLKQIIMESATPLKGTKVLKPGSHDQRVDFTTLSRTGGIVNAYRALQIAAKMKGDRKELAK